MKVLFRGQDMVVEYSDGVRRLWINKTCQGQADNITMKPVSPYMKQIMSVIKADRHPETTMLFIGLGAGILPAHYHKMKNVVVEVIEPRIDIIHAAKTYFKFPAKDIMTYLGMAENMIGFAGKYDYIVVDAYDGAVPAPGVYNDDFMKVMASHLNPGGALVYNVMADNINHVYEVKAEEVQ